LFGIGVDEQTHVQAIWDKTVGSAAGFVSARDLDHNRAAYVAGYITKKMTKDDDPRLSPGMHPEFARQSNRPGIGCHPETISRLVSAIDAPGIVEAVEDVPRSIRIDGRLYPLGRLVREHLRKRIGFTEEYREEIKKKFFAEKADEMQTLLSTLEIDTSTWQERSWLLADISAQKALKQKQRFDRKGVGKTL
jgi:hypothetical protein